MPHTGPNSIPFASITITLPRRSQRIAQGNEALNKKARFSARGNDMTSYKKIEKEALKLTETEGKVLLLETTADGHSNNCHENYY